MSNVRPVVIDESRTNVEPPARSRAVVIGVAFVAAIACYLIARMHLEESAARTAAIFLVAAVFWATEALPLFATALMVVAMQVVFLATNGGLADELSDFAAWFGLRVGEVREIKASTFFAPFASDIIMLFLGGFLLSAATVKHGVDRVAASRMLGPFTRSPAMLVGGVLAVSAFFSMWMSNTACAAMMVAIVAPLAARTRPGSKLPAALVLAAAFGANVGGIGTPIGTPPNAIAFEALRRAGVGISFVEWMVFAVPLAILMLLVTWIILIRVFPAGEGERVEPLEHEGRITRQGWMTIIVGLITVTLWLTGELHGISSGAVALLAAAALTALGILDRNDVDTIDWNVLILIWGGLAISDAMKVSGLSEAIAELPVERVGGGWTLGAIVAVLGVGLSTFMSNTAAAGLLVPMALAFGMAGREQVAIVAALATSFAMALPVSTPPNAIAYATGRVPLAGMIRTGALIGVLGVLATSLGFRFILPLVIGETMPAAP